MVAATEAFNDRASTAAAMSFGEAAGAAWMDDLSTGVMSVKRYSSFLLVGMRCVAKAARQELRREESCGGALEGDAVSRV